MSAITSGADEVVPASRHRLGVVGGARIGEPLGIHGNGRRPSKADLTPIDPELIAAYNRGIERARRAYRDEPNAVTREVFKGGYR